MHATLPDLVHHDYPPTVGRSHGKGLASCYLLTWPVKKPPMQLAGEERWARPYAPCLVSSW